MDTKIQTMRSLIGLSQREAAKLAGISNVYWQRVETGAQTPTVEIAQRIARVLGSTVEDLWPVEEA